jgi:hypothetical protein
MDKRARGTALSDAPVSGGVEGLLGAGVAGFNRLASEGINIGQESLQQEVPVSGVSDPLASESAADSGSDGVMMDRDQAAGFYSESGAEQPTTAGLAEDGRSAGDNAGGSVTVEPTFSETGAGEIADQSEPTDADSYDDSGIFSDGENKIEETNTADQETIAGNESGSVENEPADSNSAVNLDNSENNANPKEEKPANGYKPDIGGDYTQLTDWRGSNYESPRALQEERGDSLDHARGVLENYRREGKGAAGEGPREEGSKREGREASPGGDHSQPGRRGPLMPCGSQGAINEGNLTAGKGNHPGRASSGDAEGQGEESNRPGKQAIGKRGKGKKGAYKNEGSAVSSARFLPRGEGQRLSDGKRTMRLWDSIDKGMNKFKTGAEAVSAWNRDAVQAYRGRLIKAPGTAGNIARERQKWEKPGQ